MYKIIFIHDTINIYFLRYICMTTNDTHKEKEKMERLTLIRNLKSCLNTLEMSIEMSHVCNSKTECAIQNRVEYDVSNFVLKNMELLKSNLTKK